MKKQRKAALLLFGILLLCACLFSCTKPVRKSECLHEKTSVYIENRIDPTHTTEGKHDNVVRCDGCGEEIERLTIVDHKLECKTHVDGDSNFLCDTCGVRYVSDSHTHAYVCTVESASYLKVKPTCSTVGEYYYSCVCGEKSKSETFEGKYLLHHEYNVYRRNERTLAREGDCVSPALYYRSCKCGAISALTFEGTAHNYSNGKCTECNKTFTYERYGDYIYFGEYPQSLKADGVSITEEQNGKGYYLGSDGNYYAKLVGAPLVDGYTFENGEKIEKDETYYFKVESVRYRILASEDGKAYLLSDMIIDNVAYQTQSSFGYTGDNFYDYFLTPEGSFANNYKDSEVRAWLNGALYTTMFNAEERRLILTTLVKNDASTTRDVYDNEFVCEDTEDKIFFLSYQDVKNNSLGFSNFTSRTMYASDYAIAAGVYCGKASDFAGSGDWWTRSAPNHASYYASVVQFDGADQNKSVTYKTSGVVPAMWITLE